MNNPTDNGSQELPPSVSIENVLHSVFEKIEITGQRGLETGFFELDDLLNGLQRSELVVIAARPGLGKSSFLFNIIEHVCADSMLPCALFSLEMTNDQVAQRILCSRASLNAHMLRKGMLQAHEYAHLANVIGQLAMAPLWLTCVPRLSMKELIAASRNAVDKHGVHLIGIDCLQLLTASGTNRAEELACISRELKSLAVELNVPVLCTSQLNRGMFQPGSPRPCLEDLRGSGTIEEDADVVVLLHREDYYRMSEPDFQPDNIAEVIIAKQRNGPTGTVKLTFMNKTTRFENLSTQADPF